MIKSCGWKNFVVLDAENGLCNSIQAAATWERSAVYLFDGFNIARMWNICSRTMTKRGEKITKNITVNVCTLKYSGHT